MISIFLRFIRQYHLDTHDCTFFSKIIGFIFTADLVRCYKVGLATNFMCNYNYGMFVCLDCP